MHVDGQCHCGAIAFSAEVDPATASVCHCTDCQRLSGAPLRASVQAKAEDFRLLAGQPKVYVKTADSGAKRAQGFCGECGAPIYACDAANPKIYNLRLGSIRQRSDIPPRHQMWRSSALPWVYQIGDVPTSPQDAPAPR